MALTDGGGLSGFGACLSPSPSQVNKAKSIMDMACLVVQHFRPWSLRYVRGCLVPSGFNFVQASMPSCLEVWVFAVASPGSYPIPPLATSLQMAVVLYNVK
jgi:hypothetical protein